MEAVEDINSMIVATLFLPEEEKKAQRKTLVEHKGASRRCDGDVTPITTARASSAASSAIDLIHSRLSIPTAQVAALRVEAARHRCQLLARER
jgi:hypothetical protein